MSFLGTFQESAHRSAASAPAGGSRASCVGETAFTRPARVHRARHPAPRRPRIPMALPRGLSRIALAVAAAAFLSLLLASGAEARVRYVALAVPYPPDGRALRDERPTIARGDKRELLGATVSPTIAEEQACAEGSTATPPCLFGNVNTIQYDATDAACFVQIAAQNKVVASGVLIIPIDGTNKELPSNPCTGGNVLQTSCNSAGLTAASGWSCSQKYGYYAANWSWSSLDTTLLTFGNQNCVSNSSQFPSYMLEFNSNTKTNPGFYTSAPCHLALVDYGGIVYANIKVLPIFLGSSWNTITTERNQVINNVTAFFDGLTGSPFLGVIDQYMRGTTPTVTQKPWYIDASNADFTNQSTLESSVANAVCNYITNNGITDDTVYFPVFLSQTRFVLNSDFCAYHSTTYCQGQHFTFGLHYNMTGDGGCGGKAVDAVQGLMSATAHELFETMTDGAVNGSYAWLSNESPSEEIGDICNQQFHWVKLSNSNSFYVQSMWSNYDLGCVISSAYMPPTSSPPTLVSQNPTLFPTSPPLFELTLVFDGQNVPNLLAFNSTQATLIANYLTQVINNIAGSQIVVDSFEATPISGIYHVLYHFINSGASQTPLNTTTLDSVTSYVSSDAANTFGISFVLVAYTGSPSISSEVNAQAPHSGSNKEGVTKLVTCILVSSIIYLKGATIYG